jgi:hypothetical protein
MLIYEIIPNGKKERDVYMKVGATISDPDEFSEDIRRVAEKLMEIDISDSEVVFIACINKDNTGFTLGVVPREETENIYTEQFSPLSSFIGSEDDFLVDPKRFVYDQIAKGLEREEIEQVGVMHAAEKAIEFLRRLQSKFR